MVNNGICIGKTFMITNILNVETVENNHIGIMAHVNEVAATGIRLSIDGSEA